jgi:hypothetical protein
MKNHQTSMFKRTRVCLVAVSIISVGIFAAGCRAAGPPKQALANDADELDPGRAATFIAFNKSITLTPAQQKIMDEALSAIPAPCCAKNPLTTCCCPCNLAKSSWGLSKYLIAEKQYSAPMVKKTILDWLHSVNPQGFTGNACFTGGCNRSFAKNGCGGMNEQQLISDQRSTDPLLALMGNNRQLAKKGVQEHQ